MKIEFLTIGADPGDGKEILVYDPGTRKVAVGLAGVNSVNLPTIIEPNLIFGVKNAGRSKGSLDVLELVGILG